MVTKISYQHFCNLGALRNTNCFTRNGNGGVTEYYYQGDLSLACWKGYNNPSPKGANRESR
jgi:hypothetical protein